MPCEIFGEPPVTEGTFLFCGLWGGTIYVEDLLFPPFPTVVRVYQADDGKAHLHPYDPRPPYDLASSVGAWMRIEDKSAEAIERVTEPLRDRYLVHLDLWRPWNPQPHWLDDAHAKGAWAPVSDAEVKALLEQARCNLRRYVARNRVPAALGIIIRDEAHSDSWCRANL